MSYINAKPIWLKEQLDRIEHRIDRIEEKVK